MRAFFSRLTLISLLEIIMLVGCSLGPESVSPKTGPLSPSETIYPLVTTIPTLKIALTSTPNATVTPSILSTEVLEKPKLKDSLKTKLLLARVSPERYSCVIEGRDEVWLVDYPYKAPSSFLKDPEIDFRYPKWSPNGNWIAYVESKPSIIPESEMKMPLSTTGVDTIWIIHPDGSEKHQISESIPSALLAHFMGTTLACDLVSQINYLTWSYDSQYIVFRQKWHEGDMLLRYSYYLIEVSTGKSRLILTQRTSSTIFWEEQNNRFWLQGDENKLNQVTIDNIDQIEISSFPLYLPNEVISHIRYEFKSSSKDNIFYGVFYLKSEKDQTNTPDRVSIWIFDSSARTWEKITEVPIITWYNTGIFRNWVVSCDEKSNEITLLDPFKWQPIDVSKLPSNIVSSCTFREYIDNFGRDWITYEGSLDEKRTGLWATRLLPGNNESPELILDLLAFSSDFEPKKYLYEYEFQP